ncbi:MAG: DUF1570 domain-containing protein [Pirellulales bacterium]|nr:DUF1570 domain-containing protein [Pirellulales bacterium]
MRVVFIGVLLSCLALIAPARSAESSRPAMGMIEVTVAGQKIEGMPLAWASNVVHLLGRDGRLWSFDPKEATDYRQTASRFRPYSISELRAGLLRELGHGYEVSGTTHYLVAHPKGQKDKWAQRFEDLYRSFVRYFSVRGFELEKPPFPLIGIVCPDRKDFERRAAGQGVPVGSGALGFYDLTTNRIMVYDVAEKGSNEENWQYSASTIIHEATHQMAFNTGVQSRYCPPPLWVVEGLATLFEAVGIHDSQSHQQQDDRINRERFHDYRAMIADRHDGRLPAELTATDRFFDVAPMAAYAEAWAMTFYLVETQPRKFARYLAIMASRPPFVPYTAKERLADFTSIFGSNWRLFDAQFGRYMDKVE